MGRRLPVGTLLRRLDELDGTQDDGGGSRGLQRPGTPTSATTSTTWKGITDGVTLPADATHPCRRDLDRHRDVDGDHLTAEVHDYGGWWASGTNIVVPAGAIPSGYTTIMVMVTATATFASNGTGYRMLRSLKNGSQFGRDRISAISGDQTDLGFTEFVTAIAGDIITFEAYQNSGAGLNASAMLVNVVRFAPVV